MKISNKTYDILKKVALLIIPASALICSVLTALGLPYAEVITTIATALDTFMGVLIVVLSSTYKKGEN